jgi:hypothetical protein
VFRANILDVIRDPGGYCCATRCVNMMGLDDWVVGDIS